MGQSHTTKKCPIFIETECKAGTKVLNAASADGRWSCILDAIRYSKCTDCREVTQNHKKDSRASVPGPTELVRLCRLFLNSSKSSLRTMYFRTTAEVFSAHPRINTPSAGFDTFCARSEASRTHGYISKASNPGSMTAKTSTSGRSPSAISAPSCAESP